MPSSASPRHGHVIVCGLEGVGFRVVEQLHLSGTQVVVIDDDSHPSLARALEGWGVTHLRRSAFLGDVLAAADLDGAIAVVCSEVDEIRTLETALRIRELRDSGNRSAIYRKRVRYPGNLRRLRQPITTRNARVCPSDTFLSVWGASAA